eukprot:9338974-Pyramimonas_sp.AAC.1
MCNQGEAQREHLERSSFSRLQSTRRVRMRVKDARPLDAHFEAFRAGRGQRTCPRMDPGGKDAR